MKLHELRRPANSRTRRKIVGRGPGSGHGQTSGRGEKGQKARAGGSSKPWFEGGQLPLHRRIPKRGFTNVFRKEYVILNVKDLERFEAGASVTPATLGRSGPGADRGHPRQDPGRGESQQGPDGVGPSILEERSGEDPGGGRHPRGHRVVIEQFRNIFRVPELKRRVLFTCVLLIVYRIGAHVPTPGIDAHALALFFQRQAGNLLGLFDLFSGGALRRLSVFALGIMPYISASIILQLLAVVVPALERLQKEGEQGRKKITQYTRYGTVGLSAIQGLGIAIGLESMQIGTEPGGAEPRLGLPPDDDDHPDRRDDLPHVAGGADQRAGHRERHLAPDFRGDHRPDARGHCRLLDPHHPGRDESAHLPGARGFDGGRGGRGHHHDPGPAPDPGPVRKAGGGTAGVRRAEHPHPPAGEHGGGDPGDLRQLHHRLPGDHRPVHQAPVGPGGSRRGSGSEGCPTR